MIRDFADPAPSLRVPYGRVPYRRVDALDYMDQKARAISGRQRDLV